MNQILITKKLYITPELKRKKKMYKAYFILSIFLIIVLVSFYFYSSYARNKDESVSQEVLADLSTDETVADDDVLVVYLDEDAAAEAAEAAEEDSDGTGRNNRNCR